MIDALNRGHVRYVVVGGFAALLHGNARLMADLDLAVDLAPAEASRTIEALIRLGFQSRLPVNAALFADAVERARWIAEKHMHGVLAI